MDKQSKKIIGLFTRYLFIILVGLGNLYIIYKILTPLTVYILNVILFIFTNTSLNGNIIHLNTISIEIISACVAGSAFYLLLILVMSAGDIPPETRIKAIITSFSILFLLNIMRILILAPLANTIYFETIHWVFWHLISTVFVVGIWIITIKFFKIRSIPIYSDLKYVKNLIKIKKSKRKKKNN